MPLIDYGPEFAALHDRLPGERREKLLALVKQAGGPHPLPLATYDELDPRRRKDPAFLQMLLTEVRGRLIDERNRLTWQGGRYGNPKLIADLEDDEIAITAMLGCRIAREKLKETL